jgi:hypothetical protein
VAAQRTGLYHVFYRNNLNLKFTRLRDRIFFFCFSCHVLVSDEKKYFEQQHSCTKTKKVETSFSHKSIIFHPQQKKYFLNHLSRIWDKIKKKANMGYKALR